MSESLRARTTDRVNRRINEIADELCTMFQAPLDQMRYQQGLIAGLKESVHLQAEAAKGLD
jgi:hypothetical protein